MLRGKRFAKIGNVENNVSPSGRNTPKIINYFRFTCTFQIFQKNNTLYTRSTNCSTINGIVTNNPNGLCYGTTFGTVTTTDSTLYRERQIQLSTRFQF